MPLEDEEFVELLVPAVTSSSGPQRYSCPLDVRIRANIHARRQPRPPHQPGDVDQLGDDTSLVASRCRTFDGGHFYLNDHLDAVARMVSADVR